ncbi:chromosomal replication initiator protein DnaA [Apibacter adventoris]|uniref:Chromosomal replication initiator protein DnaA n=1 Tax=Apibacter adventoris TaxID=1679466 RepID=A0A0H4Q2N6_9FLAO|nr:chromosomal replication initiator protein DnaA [Apibacter adventoris]AKP61307.1 chromosomal replication initiator protein DnaA [Apibacter adventoris]PQL91047.1 chromosomal replication initiator protein DnaA [Apibacter adventoris]
MPEKANLVWKSCLDFIRDNISEKSFLTWFHPIRAIKLQDKVLTIQVPSKFYYEYLEENYIKIIKSALTKNLGKDAKLVYSIMMEKSQQTETPYTVNIASAQKAQIKVQEVDAPLYMERGVKNPFIIPGLQKLKIDSQLNSNYTFDNFIEGDSNRLARSAGKQIAKRPGGTSFNPLFIYSSVGLGKTHLVHAIGLEVKRIQPEKTVLYVSMEKFCQQFQEATKSNNRNDFIHFYQMIDVLIVDDIHFISGKKGTQEVFFHIFNHLHQSGKQIILTSDKSPVDIQDVEQRLISRFKWGLSTEIQPPDYATRLAILQQKMEFDGIELPEDVLDYIAKNIKTNIREIEGSLNSIIAQATFNKKEITLELVEKTLSNLITNSKKDITIDYIQKLICDYFKLSLDTLQSKTRKRDIVQARQLAMYFAKKYTNASLSSIGDQIGKRDHATVLHACKTVDNLFETDKLFKSYVDDLNKKLTSDI